MTLVQEAMSIMEAMPRRNQQIVLELLRAMSSQPTFREKPEKSANTKMNAAVMELAGLWKDHENELTVEETVRDMRKGRSFDHRYRCFDMVSQRKSISHRFYCGCNAFFDFYCNLYGTGAGNA